MRNCPVAAALMQIRELTVLNTNTLYYTSLEDDNCLKEGYFMQESSGSRICVPCPKVYIIRVRGVRL